MNQKFSSKLFEKNFFSKALGFITHEKGKNLRHYIMRIFSSLSKYKECRDYIIEEKLLKKMISVLYQNDDQIQIAIFLSIFHILINIEELHEYFFEENGSTLIIYFLDKTNKEQNYIGMKLLVFLSRYKSYLQKMGIEPLSHAIIRLAQKKDYRCIREAIRFYLNICICNTKVSKKIISNLCQLILNGIESQAEENVEICLFGLQYISQNFSHHEIIIAQKEIDKSILLLDINILKKLNGYLVLYIFNMICNNDSQKHIVDIKY